MCMRFASDDGREFLSSREPRTPKPSTEKERRPVATESRSLWRDFLEGLYFRGGSGR